MSTPLTGSAHSSVVGVATDIPSHASRLPIMQTATRYGTDPATAFHTLGLVETILAFFLPLMQHSLPAST
jgi:hypothetical protein